MFVNSDILDAVRRERERRAKTAICSKLINKFACNYGFLHARHTFERIYLFAGAASRTENNITLRRADIAKRTRV